jgi:hypothetical protein
MMEIQIFIVATPTENLHLSLSPVGVRIPETEYSLIIYGIYTVVKVIEKEILVMNEHKDDDCRHKAEATF